MISTPVLFAIAAAFILQGILSFIQMRHLTNDFLRLRKKGKVAFGRKSGGFHAGAVVMFRIDDDGIIQEARKLEGITAFARLRDMKGFEGRYVGSLTEEDGPKNHRNLRKAIADASLTYRRFIAGESVPESPSPLRRLIGNIE